MAPSLETITCVNLPNRDEFLLRTVAALPKASSSGLVLTRSWPSSCDDFDDAASRRSLDTYARWRSTYLHVSVLPEPDGPDTMIACDSPVETRSRYMRSATAKMCGG